MTNISAERIALARKLVTKHQMRTTLRIHINTLIAKYQKSGCEAVRKGKVNSAMWDFNMASKLIELVTRMDEGLLIMDEMAVHYLTLVCGNEFIPCH
jgi:hypothetical protein